MDISVCLSITIEEHFGCLCIFAAMIKAVVTCVCTGFCVDWIFKSFG